MEKNTPGIEKQETTWLRNINILCMVLLLSGIPVINHSYQQEIERKTAERLALELGSIQHMHEMDIYRLEQQYRLTDPQRTAVADLTPEQANSLIAAAEEPVSNRLRKNLEDDAYARLGTKPVEGGKIDMPDNILAGLPPYIDIETEALAGRLYLQTSTDNNIPAPALVINRDSFSNTLPRSGIETYIDIYTIIGGNEQYIGTLKFFAKTQRGYVGYRWLSHADDGEIIEIEKITYRIADQRTTTRYPSIR